MTNVGLNAILSKRSIRLYTADPVPQELVHRLLEAAVSTPSAGNQRVAGLRRLLELPDHVAPLALVPVGHPAEHKPPAVRLLLGRVHQNGR